jgi:LacI family transcriptional regulator
MPSACNTRPGVPRRRVVLAMDYYLRLIHEGVVRYAQEANWHLDSSMHYEGVLPRDWAGDGALVMVRSSKMQAFVRKLGVPAVSLAIPPKGIRLPSVLMDNVEAGRMGARHFLSRGFNHFAYYLPQLHTVVSQRAEGFSTEVAAAGRTVHELKRSNEGRMKRRVSRAVWLAERLRALPRPLAVMAEDDKWAIEVMEACQKAGLNVPADVAVLGVDNDPMLTTVGLVPLSSVDNDLPGLGYRAARLLDRLMTGEKPPAADICHPPLGVVARRSTDALSVEQPDVREAIAFLLTHFHEPITVGEVARHTNLSLRRLQVHFKRSVGRSIQETLFHLRVENAKRMLRDTSLKIDAIARRSGFANGNYLARVLRRTEGARPTAFRLKTVGSPQRAQSPQRTSK